MKGKCLPRKIQTDWLDENDHSKGSRGVLCKVVEAQRTSDLACDPTTGRKTIDAKIKPAVLKQLELTGQCGVAGREPCNTWSLCEINQLTDENSNDGTACQTGNGTTSAPGYCYIDKDINANSVELKKCPENQQQVLKFVDTPQSKIPAQGAVAFIACLGASTDQEAP